MSQGVMASRKGYTSLPVDSETNKADAEQSGGREHTPAGAGDGSVGAKGDAASGRDATSGSGTEKEASAAAEKAGGSPGKDAAADLTGAEHGGTFCLLCAACRRVLERQTNYCLYTQWEGLTSTYYSYFWKNNVKVYHRKV